MEQKDNATPPVERGWQHMQHLLDREMPLPQQEKKRRRAMIWWWKIGAAAVLIVGAGVGWWMFQPTKKMDFEPEMVQNEVVLPEKPIITLNSQTPVSATGLKNVEIKSAENQELRKKANADGNFVKTELKNVASGKSKNVDIQLNNLKINDLKRNLTTSQIVEGLQKNSLASIAEPTNSVEDVPFMPSKIQYLAYKTSLPAPENTPIQVQDTKKLSKTHQKWQLGVSAGMLTNYRAQAWGWSAGLVADHQLSERWQFRAGLQWISGHFTVKNGKVLDMPSSDVFSSFQNTTNTQMADNEYFRVPMNAWECVEMPVQFFFQPNRKWKLGLGTALNHTIGVSSGFGIEDHQKNAIEPDMLQQILEERFPRWQAIGLISFGHNISKSLEINASSRFVFDTRIKNVRWQQLSNSNQQDADPVMDTDDKYFQSKDLSAPQYRMLKFNRLPDLQVQVIYRF